VERFPIEITSVNVIEESFDLRKTTTELKPADIG